jgi:uncharacterized membrane protein YidH (DUF202 family)
MVARALLIRGMLAGLAGGIVSFAVARLIGEPAVGAAIAFEQQRAAAAGAGRYVEMVSRDIQGSLGLLAAVAVYGIALGGLYALVFAAVYGRARPAGPARTALWLAAGAFTTVFLVPFLKYPANPPAVGRPESIGTRTALYLAMVAISLLAAAYAAWLARRLETRMSPGHALLTSLAAYGLIVLTGGLLLPGVNEVPDGFPAVTLWDFRVASIAIQAVTWATVGLVFAGLAERALEQRPTPTPARRRAVTSR